MTSKENTSKGEKEGSESMGGGGSDKKEMSSRDTPDKGRKGRGAVQYNLAELNRFATFGSLMRRVLNVLRGSSRFM